MTSNPVSILHRSFRTRLSWALGVYLIADIFHTIFSELVFHFPIPDDEESEEEVVPTKPTVPVPKRRFEGEDEEEDVAVRVSAPFSRVLAQFYLKHSLFP